MRMPQHPSMQRRQFLTVLGAGAAGLLLRSHPLLWADEPTPQGRRPNIVLILADDLGYGELGIQGCRDIPTPHIDSIAANGVRFTNGYVSCPICAPTRAGLMTGRYQQRFGLETNPGPERTAAENYGLPREETTLAERLKAMGYATGLVGKWHLGYKPELTPPQRGFDEFFGFLSGAHAYLPGGRRGSSLLRGAEPVVENEYLTDAFARESVSFIARHKDSPFFLYLAMNAVHAPLEAGEKYLRRFPDIQDPKRKTYACMTAAMDDAVGAVLAKLRELKLEENTLIVFLSDNGGPTLQTTSSNGPLRGYKGQVFEGGVRIPFLAQWKGRLPAGKVYEKPVTALDIHPTVVAATGGKVSPDWKLDGVDLLPYLTGAEAGKPHETLCWRMGEQKHAIRHGDFKLVVERDLAKPALFNLSEDIGEKNDLADRMPDKVKDLAERYESWDRQMARPRWQWGGGATDEERRRMRQSIRRNGNPQ